MMVGVGGCSAGLQTDTINLKDSETNARKGRSCYFKSTEDLRPESEVGSSFLATGSVQVCVPESLIPKRI